MEQLNWKVVKNPDRFPDGATWEGTDEYGITYRIKKSRERPGTWFVARLYKQEDGYEQSVIRFANNYETARRAIKTKLKMRRIA